MEQDPSIPSQYRDNAPKPPGVLRKNAKTIAITGVALLIILVIAFTGNGAPKPKPTATAMLQVPTLTRLDNAAQYKRQVDDGAERLRAEQADLARTKEKLEHEGLIAPAGAHPAEGQQQGQQISPAEQQRLAFEAERRKKEQAALFASNIALTFRKDQPSSATPVPPTMESLAAQLHQISQGKLLGAPPSVVQQPAQNTGVSRLDQLYENTTQESKIDPEKARSVDAPELGAVDGTQVKLAGVIPPVVQKQDNESRERHVEGSPQDSAIKGAVTPGRGRPDSTIDPDLQLSTGKQYRLFEGTIIETVLTNRLNGSFTGPVNTMVTTDLYAPDHYHLLIPKGTRVLGEAAKVSNVGQQRLAVSFHRMILPSDANNIVHSYSLDKFTGMNQIGETGLRDQVNNHFAQIFGVSLALGAIAGIEQAGANYGSSAGGLDAYRYGTANSLSQSATRILDRYLNILPTFTIREGHRVKVYLMGDIMLPAYSGHRLAGDL